MEYGGLLPGDSPLIVSFKKGLAADVTIRSAKVHGTPRQITGMRLRALQAQAWP